MEKVTFQISLKITSKNDSYFWTESDPIQQSLDQNKRLKLVKQDMEEGRRLLLQIDLFTISLAIYKIIMRQNSSVIDW